MQPANRIAFGVTLAVHALALSALLSQQPVRRALLAAPPVMMELLTPREAARAKSQPVAELPKPKHVVKRVPRQPSPPLTRPVEVASLTTPPPPAPAPEPLPTPPAPQATAPQAIAPQAPSFVVTEPIFNADYLSNPEPIYPSVSRRMGEQGRVILRVLVNVKGATDEVQVRTSSGYVRLDDAARDTVRRWRFVPAKRGTEPLSAWVLIPISFRLDR